MALKVTDAELRQEFLIPVGLARTVGVFRDMVECATDHGTEPVPPRYQLISYCQDHP